MFPNTEKEARNDFLISRHRGINLIEKFNKPFGLQPYFGNSRIEFFSVFCLGADGIRTDAQVNEGINVYQLTVRFLCCKLKRGELIEADTDLLFVFIADRNTEEFESSKFE